MEVYILDDQLRRDEVVENYESMIWTDRFVDSGDFILEIDPLVAENPLFNQGTMLAIDKSDRVMVTKSVETSLNDDGVRILKVEGESLEGVLKERPNKYGNITAGTATSTLYLGGSGGVGGAGATPTAILRQLVSDCCVTNTAFQYQIGGTGPFYYPERIPFIQTVGGYISGMIPEPTVTPIIQTEIDTLFNTIKSLCDIYRLGFRLVRPADDSKLYFEVYTGYDRTSTQSVLPAVIFSSDLDNLTDTSDLTSTKDLKNTAYVFAPGGSRVVYGEGVDSTVLGFQKKVLIVDANDITDIVGVGGVTLASLNAKLDQRGMEELAKHRVLIGFDGKVPQNSSLVYGVDYKLGDLVEQRSDRGARNIMRVSEQIFVHDKEGERSYPTLTLDSFLVAGSWDSVSITKKWDSGYTTEVWNSM